MSRIGQDYISLVKPSRRHRRRLWWGLALILAIAGATLGLVGMRWWGAPSTTAPGERTIRLNPPLPRAPATSAPSPTSQRLPRHGAAPALAGGGPAAAILTAYSPGHGAGFVGAARMSPRADKPGGWARVQVQRGDTLSLAFARHHLAYTDSLAIANLDTFGPRFTNGLQPGDTMLVRADENGHVLALAFPLDAIRTLRINAEGDGYTARVEEADVTVHTTYAVGTIAQSFYLAALEAGMPDSVIMELASIYDWAIDFALDIRAGDRFVVIYQEIYANGEKIDNGPILAAEFQLGERRLQALRFTNARGEGAYYTPDGEAMHKAFLRNPLDQFRISSHFNLHRKHPILHTIRAHTGTDYAAPTGTPIRATGDGRITLRGVDGGYGKMVILDHGDEYTTRYGHMSRFAPGQRVGSHVEQGEIIGYVGMTGRATGPHLHYEFRRNGVAKNPVTVDLPGAPPIAGRFMDEFRRHTQPLLAQIQTLRHTMLAQAQSPQ